MCRMVGGIAPKQVVLGQLLDLVSVPAYATDRFNRVVQVNARFAELVGDPIVAGLRGDDLFIASLLLGRFRSRFPRAPLEVSRSFGTVLAEVAAGRLLPKTETLMKKALALDNEATRLARDALAGGWSDPRGDRAG
jgi:hypothetical protein